MLLKVQSKSFDLSLLTWLGSFILLLFSIQEKSRTLAPLIAFCSCLASVLPSPWYAAAENSVELIIKPIQTVFEYSISYSIHHRIFFTITNNVNMKHLSFVIKRGRPTTTKDPLLCCGRSSGRSTVNYAGHSVRWKEAVKQKKSLLLQRTE